LASLPVPDRFRVSTAGGQAIVKGNIEGMALDHSRRTLRLISDNNASATQTTRVYTLSVRL
jgi:hypothetical protein